MKLERLILGTVQFGLHYGINNSSGQTSEAEAHEILHYARAEGITTLDTAAAYGNSEEIIGSYHKEHGPFSIITKFDKHNGLSWKESIEQSIEKLNVEIVDFAMFHSFDDYIKSKGSLRAIVSKGKGKYFRKLGVSVYTNEELESLLDDDRIELIQLPFNMFDNEHLRGDMLRKLKDKGKIIHTRSVFLQGLFFKEPNTLDSKFDGIKDELTIVKKVAEQAEMTVNSLALNYVASKDYIDGVLIGVDSKNQLEQNINALDATIDEAAFKAIDKLKIKHIDLLNPSKW